MEQVNKIKGSISHVKDNINNLLGKKAMFNLVVVVLVGILLVIVVDTIMPKTQTTFSPISNSETSADISSDSITSTEISNKLTTMLNNMKGVGNVQVMINYENEGQLVPAINQNNGTSTTDEKDEAGGTRNTTQTTDGKTVVITTNNGNSQPLILEKQAPKISGVMIVAEGAANQNMKYEIAKAVSVVLNLPINKVYVYSMK